MLLSLNFSTWLKVLAKSSHCIPIAMKAEEKLNEVVNNSKKLCIPGKGILASDESTGTVGKRLASVGLQNTEDMRRSYREIFYTSSGIGNYFSGVIMFEETLYQSTKEGIPFVKILEQEGILPGIKVDMGLVIIPGTDGETSTAGLDSLGERCKKYYTQGARFAKWRGVIKISAKCPSRLAIREISEGLAHYALICQQQGLVPIVEPEILIDGIHRLEKSAEISEVVFSEVVYSLQKHGVLLEGILIKPQMVLPGFDSTQNVNFETCARTTLRVLERTIPVSVPGIMFLSGGQSEQEATENLNALNILLKLKFGNSTPWNLSFSFGRALQASVLRIWAGKPENVPAAQAMALEIARANAQATLGVYHGPHPSTCTDDLRESFRGWRNNSIS